MNHVGGVAAIIPVFNPDKDFADRLRSILRQVHIAIVVDDGSDDRAWETALRHTESLTVIHQQNLGIAAALNEGIRVALQLYPDIRYVITVDQDSQLDADYLTNAIHELTSAIAAGLSVGAICAEQLGDWKVTPRDTSQGFRSTLEVAQSGLLIPTATFRAIGAFNESLFIDCVDTEYVLRLLQNRSKVIMGRGCRMQHLVGETINIRLFGQVVKWRGNPLKFSFHPALRRYYISRNRILVYRKYFWVDPRWNARELIVESRTALLSICFGPDKWKQCLAIGLGLIDGLSAKAGKASAARQKTLRGSGD